MSTLRDDEAETLEESRMLASAAKRKLQRLLGAQAALQRVQREGVAALRREEGVAEAKAAVDAAQSSLMSVLEACDGGDAYKRLDRDCAEAAGAAEYVRSAAAARLYRAAVEREEAAALSRLEEASESRAALKAAKERLAYSQGVLYGLVETDGRGEGGEVRLQKQLAVWADEASAAKRVIAEQQPHLRRRRDARRRFWHQQGWRKAAERFGAVCGVGPADALRLKLEVLAADARQLRTAARGSLRALVASHEAHAQASWELQCTLGAVAFLTEVCNLPELSGLQPAATLQTALAAEEYEAELEARVLRKSLKALAPKLAEETRLRFAWHSAAGETAVARVIGMPEEKAGAKEEEVATKARAVEAVRREHAVLEGKLGKLEGKLQVLSGLRSCENDTRAAAPRMLGTARLKALRLGAKMAGLQLLLMRYDKANANLHAAGGALIALRRLERDATHKSLTEPRLFEPPMRQDPSGAQGLLTAAGLSPEVREFLRGSFAPMLRAAFNAALQAASPDPFEFLAQWFWTHSEAAAQPSSTKPRELSVGAGAPLWSQSRLCELRDAVARRRLELLGITRGIGATLPAEQQLHAAEQMFALLRLPAAVGLTNDLESSPLARHAVLFPPLGSGEEAAVTPTQPLMAMHAASNAKLLDALASVMLQYPRVGLIVSVHEIEQPNPESDAPVAGAPERSIIARRRADAIVDALLRRQVLARRIESRTLPQAAPSSQLTLTLLAPNGKSVPPRAPVPVPSPGEAKSEARPDTALKAVREELQALRKAFEASLRLEAPLSLRVAVLGVRLAPETPLTHRAAELSVSICYGAHRANHASEAKFRVDDAAVEIVDAELWDAGRAQLLCGCSLSVAPLLSGSQATIRAELPVLPVAELLDEAQHGAGGASGPLGWLTVEAEAVPKGVVA
mmetsp:Transcript_21549/g.71260  ORF Transcript_21549/g.71260 Transcript_21549/m.71260 type:complete len:914 (+) Transcript_21549:14-2755(+)|eukprot:CAMPEP_0196672078 /NCGR_PEP_ID=MMETSP1090-20130531/2194_1 /TAXON_ID=37098 /ORGANISM="Isochrysis sp, Strain CCMP1244" /LENGTH=913 /DNA_ID=CAMNT_0042009775 /DNA_START=14 /DNA_END=2755 /DNA_ORIENTATION=+